MNLNHIRLGFNLFFKPAALLLLGLLALNFIDAAATQPMLVQLANIAIYGVVCIFILAAYLVAHGAWLLVKAERGIGESCHSCGMPVRYVSPGRFGPYYHCLACGSNRRAMH